MKEKTKQDILREKQRLRKEEFLANGGSFLKCRLCDYQSIGSLVSHICRKHKVSTQEYLRSFPDECLQQDVRTHDELLIHKTKIAEWFTHEENYQKYYEKRSFPSEIKHWLNKGFSEEEAIKLVSNFQQEQSRKANTLENNLLKSELYRGDKNPMSLKSLSQRHNVDIEIAHKCTPCFGRTRDLHPFFGKKHSEKALEKIADSWHLKNPSWRSKGEIEVASFCSSLGLINENLKIGRWNVDIQFQDKPLIIEYFGDFWHMNPLLFEANDINQYTQAKASDVWARDARKLDELSHKGFKVFVVWEKAWKFSRVEQESQITKHFEEATR